jgi:hypothetical protein
MDYGSGTELWYAQWRYMRNPDVIFRPLQGDDKGAEAQSPECKSKLNLLTSLIKSETIGINFLKLLAAEEQPNQKSSDGKYTTRTYSENGVKIIFYENGWPDEIDHLFKVELSGQSAKDAGLNSFWLYFNPNAITTENIPVVLALKDTMPLPGEKAYCYLPMDNFPRGISAQAAFSDMVAQQVFLTAEIVSTGGVLRAGRFATGAAIDLGLQLAMLDIIKTSLGERFTTTDLLAEVSWPSVLYSGLTYNKKIPVVVNILGSFTVGFADALAKETFREKSAKNLNLVQASYEGFKQALITAGIEAVLRLVKIPARYSRKQVEEALEDAGKELNGAGDDFINSLLDANKYIQEGKFISNVKKIDLMGGKTSQLGGDFANIDLQATKGINGDASKLSQFIQPNSIDEIVVSNPFPTAPFAGPKEFFLAEASKVMKPGTTLTVNGTISNKFFKNVKAGNIEDLGFEIVEFQVPLKSQFQNTKFYQVDGVTQIPNSNILTTIIRKR